MNMLWRYHRPILSVICLTAVVLLLPKIVRYFGTTPPRWAPTLDTNPFSRHHKARLDSPLISRQHIPMKNRQPISSHSKSPKKRYVCKVKPDRAWIGVTIYQYTAAYGLAKRTNRTPAVCDSDYDLNKLFSNLSIPIYTKSCPCSMTDPELNPERRSTPYIYKFLRNSPSNVSVIKYMHGLKIFYEYIADLKQEFTILEALTNTAQKTIHKITEVYTKASGTLLSFSSKGECLVDKKSPVYIGVHIRRGDKVGSLIFQTVPAAYIKRAMDHMRQKYNNSPVIFIVATNGLSWSKKHVTGSDIFFTADYGIEEPEDDFSMIVNCNHTIFTIGTFGWWMSLLAGGDVIYFRNYLQWHLSDRDIHGIIPKSWMMMT